MYSGAGRTGYKRSGRLLPATWVRKPDMQQVNLNDQWHQEFNHPTDYIYNIYIYSHHFVMLVWQASQPPVRVLATVPLKKQHLKAMPRDIPENLWVASWQCSAAHELEHQVDWAWWSRQWSSWRQCRPEIEITGIQHSVKSYGARRARLNESVPR